MPRWDGHVAALAPQLAELRRAGWSVTALARRYRISKSTVVRLAPIPSAGRSEPAHADDGRAPRYYRAQPVVVAELPRPLPPLGPPAGPKGTEHGRSKLTEAHVIEMRRLRHEDPTRWTLPALAKRFKVSRLNVGHIVAGRTWRHVPMPRPTPDAPDIGPRP